MAHSGPHTSLESNSSRKTTGFPPDTVHGILYVISSSSKSGTSSHSIIRHEQVPSVEQRYSVDKTREWMFILRRRSVEYHRTE